MTRSGFVYIVASGRNGTIYLGVTSSLPARAYQHRHGLIDGFSKRYGCTHLVWYEAHDDIQDARLRELQLKKWNRSWKLRLIEELNPTWRDLYDSIASG
ncbi:MAG TPA: GIY-YIG nuclease family protein [Sphingomonas sp.]